MKFEIHLDAVVPPECTFEQVKQAFEAQGWDWVQSIPAQEAQFHEEIWVIDGDRGAARGAARYIRDHFLDLTIIRTESDIYGMVTTLLEQLSAQLPILFIDDLVAMVDSKDPWTRGFALRGLAAITERFDGDTFQALKDALLESDPQMRGLALRCLTRYPWFQFIKVLEEAASRETVPELRAEQLALIEDIRKHGKRGT
ncbi:HEAT repeat domain-containing protein [Corallococcus interemptor]|uniref:HEAT repeat domain-containing protein n=1 Tax=Corallococcus interemptor TaxID=2316720 RepID=UPI003D094A4F